MALSAGGTLLYTAEKVSEIVLACGVLHYIAQTNGVLFEVQIPAGRPIPSSASIESHPNGDRTSFRIFKMQTARIDEQAIEMTINDF